MIGTVLGRTQARTRLQEQQQYLERQNEITGDPERTFDEKLQSLFELGCDRFDLELGGLSRINPATNSFEVESTSAAHDHLTPGTQAPLSETYCQLTVDTETTIGVTDPQQADLDDILAHQKFGVETYLGTRIELENEPDRTFFFVDSDSRSQPFSDAERTFHGLMAQSKTGKNSSKPSVNANSKHRTTASNSSPTQPHTICRNRFAW